MRRRGELFLPGAIFSPGLISPICRQIDRLRSRIFILVGLGIGVGLISQGLQGCAPSRAASPSLSRADGVDEDGRFAWHPPSPRDSLPARLSHLFTGAGQVTLPEGEWAASVPQSENPGWPRTVALELPDRRSRIAVFETRFARGAYATKDLDLALAFLFKLDMAPAKVGEIGRNLRLYLPPLPPKNHLGLALLSDTNLVFLHVKTSDTILKSSILAWADTCSLFEPGNQGNVNSQNTFLAAIENTLGLKATEDSAYSEAAVRFQLAMTLDSLNPRYLANRAAMDQALKHTPDGIQRILAHPSLFQDTRSGDMYGVLGGLYEEVGDYEKAKQCALKGLEKDPDNREWLINLSDALWGLGDRVQSKNVLLRRYAEKPDFRLLIYLAGTYLGLEEYENARNVLKQAQSMGPPDIKSVEYTLRAHIGLKDFAAAQDYAHELQDSLPESSMIRLLIGITAFNLKQYREALRQVQIALQIEPSLREAQELSTQITTLLGGKSNHILRTPLAPLKTTLHLRDAPKRLKDSTLGPIIRSYPLTLIDQNIVYSWAPNAAWQKTRHQLFFIPDGRRLLQFSELNYELNPTSMRFYVNRFRLYDSLMRPLDDGKLRDFYVTGNHTTDMHPENLLVHLPIKAKAGPHFLEVMTTEASQVASPDFPYVRFEQQAVYPLVSTRFEILHPPANLLVSPRGECRLDSLPDRLILTMTKPVLPLDRSFFSTPPEFSTGFSASPFTTWRDIGKSYWATLEAAGLSPDSLPFSVRERAAEITSARRDLDPIKALFRYVRDSVRYDNYEFSLQAQIPVPSDQILQKGLADCKGHALLLVQMLKSLGYQANLFLVDLDHPGEPELPSLNQFNHMIVFIPAQKGQNALYLDPTDKFMAFRRSPLNLEGRIGLIVDRETSRLGTVPEIDIPQEHQAFVYHRLDVGKDGLADGTDSVVLNGKLASWFREHYHNWNQATRQQTLMSWMSENYPPFIERGFSLNFVDDPDQPLSLVFRYETRFALQKGDRDIEHYPKLELSFLRFPPPHLCRQPVYFAHEVGIQSEWLYRLPKGYAWKTTDIDREVNANYLRWKFSIQQSVPEDIVVKQKWQVEPFVATPEEYGRSYTEWSPILARAGLRLTANRP